MKIAVRYQSRGGNTKAVAEIIAAAAGVKAEPITTPLGEPVDVLFVGGGVYKWDIDSLLKEYLGSLDPADVGTVAAYSTAGGMDGAKRIIAILKERGVNVCDETLPVLVGLRNHAALGGKGCIELNDKKTSAINNFVKSITQK
jgi:flavodoxin